MADDLLLVEGKDDARLSPSRAGIWLLPDNAGSGAIEDFLYSMTGERTHPLHEHARRSIDAIPKGHRLFKQKDQAKALLYTLLAWQARPGRLAYFHPRREKPVTIASTETLMTHGTSKLCP